MDGMPVSCVLSAVSDKVGESLRHSYAIANNWHYVSYWFGAASCRFAI
jgi:hypothetical protein